ncbi:MAG: hypothetical protein Q7S86_00835 [bacterium]|nr:hypothetical protein [bacterium]
MKTVSYPNFGKGEGRVDYKLFEGFRCVFSGVTSDGTSTINAAERIVKAIAEVEKATLMFYDLQTQKGYDFYRPGEYSFSRLIVDGAQTNPENITWRPEKLPENVLKVFGDYIGPNPHLQQ